MAERVPGFRLGGIPVRIEPTFLLVALLLGFGAREGAYLLAWVVIVTGSVLAHELGHAVAFRAFGRQPAIVLQGMGGLTYAAGGLTPGRHIAVSLAGPGTGLVLLGLPALVAFRSGLGEAPGWETVLADLVFVNVGWSVLNLLPILPLDGGNVAASVLDLLTGGRGEQPARALSAAVAAAAGVLALSAGYTFGAVFAGFFAAENLSRLLAGRDRGRFQRIGEGYQALGRSDLAGARAAAAEAAAGRPSRRVGAAAADLSAWAALAAGDRAGVDAALARLPAGSAPGEFLQARLALDAGRAGEAVETLVPALRQEPPWPVGPMVAEALAGAGDGLVDDLAGRLLSRGPHGVTGAARLQVHLHLARRWAESAQVGERVMAEGPEAAGMVAYNVACSRACLGDTAGALDWLERAVDAGFADATLLEADHDLDLVRGEERFRRLQAKLG